MDAIVLRHARCPVCGHRAQGVSVGYIHPLRIRTLHIRALLARLPDRCAECGHPIGAGLYDAGTPDPATIARYEAWRSRQRQRARDRRHASAAVRQSEVTPA